MSIIILNSSIGESYGNDTTCIAFSTNGSVTNIEEINLIIYTTYLLIGEPLKSSVALLKRCGAIIILRGGEGCDDFNLHSLTIPE